MAKSPRKPTRRASLRIQEAAEETRVAEENASHRLTFFLPFLKVSNQRIVRCVSSFDVQFRCRFSWFDYFLDRDAFPHDERTKPHQASQGIKDSDLLLLLTGTHVCFGFCCGMVTSSNFIKEPMDCPHYHCPCMGFFRLEINISYIGYFRDSIACTVPHLYLC